MLGLCLALFALGAEPSAVAVFVRQAAGAEPVRGSLQSIEKDWTVHLGGAAAAAPGAALVSLRRAVLRLPAYPAGPQVIFANGDRLAAEVLAIENDQLRLRALFGDALPRDGATQELTVPLAAIAEIWFQP